MTAATNPTCQSLLFLTVTPKNIEQSQFKFGISFVSIRTTLLDKGEGAGRDKVKLVTLMLVLSLLAEDTLHLLAALASTGGDSLSLSAL